jgi:serine/threonine protein kinase
LPGSGRPAAKVSDFGMARLADVASATPPGTIVGTPRFASPEALAGETVGPTHDVYGLAGTLYVLLTGGRTPYPLSGEATLSELRRLQAKTRPAGIRAHAPEVDAVIENVLLQGLAQDPRSRPTPGRIVRTLERAQARLLASAGGAYAHGEVSVSRWRVVLAGLGLGALGLWTRARKGRSRDTR